MRNERTRLKFWVKLSAEKERMDIPRKLRDFHQYAVGRGAGKYETRLLKLSDILRVHLVAMPMTLRDNLLPVRIRGNSALLEMSGVGTEPHGRSVLPFRP